MTRSGLDEAGLGPLLGPYCAAVTTLNYESEVRSPLESCPDVLAPRPEADKLAVGDSKEIYSPGRGEELERSVLAFFHFFFRRLPKDALDFLSTADPDFKRNGAGIPWFESLEQMRLPLEAELSGPALETLDNALRKAGISPGGLHLTVQPARSFNQRLASASNKAGACQAILSPLLLEAYSRSDETVVDRQGGRRYYGEWLLDLFPGRGLRALRELKHSSLYELDGKTVEFRIKADADCFETALASLFAKYSRELCMTAFNAYWTGRQKDLKKTAGYYSDGRRFIRDLKAGGIFPEDSSILVRNK